MKQRRVGLWLIGACGGVASTCALGLSALQRGLTDTTSLVTALPSFAGLDLDPFTAFEVGGHDIREASLYQGAMDLHERANVFTARVLEGCKADLDRWTKNVRPGSVLNAGPTIDRLADL